MTLIRPMAFRPPVLVSRSRERIGQLPECGREGCAAEHRIQLHCVGSDRNEQFLPQDERKEQSLQDTFGSTVQPSVHLQREVSNLNLTLILILARQQSAADNLA